MVNTSKVETELGMSMVSSKTYRIGVDVGGERRI